MLPKAKTKPKHPKKENQPICFLKRVKEEHEKIMQGKNFKYRYIEEDR